MTLLYDGIGSNGLAFIADQRTETCTGIGGVYRHWAFGRACLGQEWQKALRIAVREYKTPHLNTKQCKALTPELAILLKTYNIKTLIVLQSPPARGAESVHHNAWTVATGRTDNPYGWAGTCEDRGDYFLCPILHPGTYEWAYWWLIRRWMCRALSVARGDIHPFVWPTRLCPYDPAYLAVDIETNMKRDIISCIGLGTSRGACTFNWDTYQVAGTELVEPGRSESDEVYVRYMLASNIPKVGHNFSFDVHELRRRGIEVNGEIHDTLLLCKSIYGQYRRGLQQVAAIEGCIEPWKSLYKPKRVRKGQDPWVADPEGTRAYNTKDVIATGLIWESLSEKLA